ncbi:MAG TPA: ATP synthase F1 subunit gamma [Candidatus Goldiibacteriota bacterium]|jgi:F-type H+-transporting ATPase subunit gamma|nr:ATP synthase F1 subunit gamma [Candidatus Goldiibacteriota bacterium]HPN65036.1 ATP synthase F1 subunit gamma [Candidatus Goldiibacteriota bacterium]HRQ44891.1 ATP synthase F1 subunit gamma [Candidatus Goldiibacteriota bacterium]
MATLRDIRKRIKSAQNIQQITKAMKMVSAAKLRKSQDRTMAARPYADKIAEVIGELMSSDAGSRFPLLKEHPEVKKEAVILVTADKGLCGSFNGNLAKEVMIMMKANPDMSMFYIGKKGFDLLKKFGKENEKFKFNDRYIGWPDVEEIGKMIIDNFSAGKYGKVTLIYSKFQTNLTQNIVKKQLLPVVFEGPAEQHAKRDYLYEPTEKDVLENLFVRYVKTSIYRAVLESQASEHGVRMAAMEKATNNANDMIRSLTLLANKTRQAAITNEILEIVGGANAIKG